MFFIHLLFYLALKFVELEEGGVGYTWWYYDYNNTMLPAAGWEEMMVVVAVRVNENWLLLF